MPLVDTVKADADEDAEQQQTASETWRLPTWVVVAGVTLAVVNVFSVAGWPRWGVLKVTPAMTDVPTLGPAATGVFILGVCVVVAAIGAGVLPRFDGGER